MVERVDPVVDQARLDGRAFFVADHREIRLPDGRTPRREVVDRLKESIARVGVINPLTVTHDYTLVAGLNRLIACRELEVGIPVLVLAPDEPVRELEVDENLVRAHLTREELSEVRAFKARALVAKCAEGKSVRAAAEELGIPRSTAADAATVRHRTVAGPPEKAIGRDGKRRPTTRTTPAARAARAERARTLRAEGKCVREVAAALGVSSRTAAADLALPAPVTSHAAGVDVSLPAPEVSPGPEVTRAGLAELRAAWANASTAARAAFLREIDPRR